MSDTPKSQSAVPGPSKSADVLAVLGIIALPLLMFADLLLGSADRVVSHYTADVSQFFIRMREFGVAEILNGNIPLWNPHLMSGTPYVGNWQSAVFYPLNAVYLVLPVGRAVNVDVVLHLILLGVFTYVWIRGRGVSALGAFFGVMIVLFSGPVFLRVLAGHITLLAVLSWAPLLLAAVDRIFQRAEENRPLLGWTLVGVGATAMQMLAGHPQTLFITAAMVATYCLLRFPGTSGRLRALRALACVALCPVPIAAAQLFAGFHTGTESIRTGGTTMEFATLFSFPPENLLTLVAPAFFGDRIHLDYWGRWAFWDTSIYMGIFGFGLALLGALYGPAKARRFAVFMALAFLFVAMGRYTPIYTVLLYVPGFSMFRGPSKFLIVFILLGGLLAGIGVDHLRTRQGSDSSKKLALFLYSAAFPLFLCALWILFSVGGYWEGTPWRTLVALHLPEGLLQFRWLTLDDEYFDKSALVAVLGMLVAFLTCLVFATLLWFSGRSSRIVYIIVVLGVAEVFGFARLYRTTFDLSDHRIPTLEQLYENEPGDYRVLHIGGTDDPRNPRNHPMMVGKSGLWGYEPVFLGLYGLYMAHVTGGGRDNMLSMSYHEAWGSDPVDVAMNAETLDMHLDAVTHTAILPQMFNMLRCRYTITPPNAQYAEEGVYENADYLPHFLLLRDYLVLPAPLARLATISEDTFDPWSTVVLTEEPDPTPAIGDGPVEGTVEILDQSTDHMTLSISIQEPCILLITDPYSSGWHARGLQDSDRQEYHLTTGNFALQALPLRAGNHTIRLEYLPSMSLLGLNITFTHALWLSAAAAMLYILCVGFWAVRGLPRYSTKNAA